MDYRRYYNNQREKERQREERRRKERIQRIVRELRAGQPGQEKVVEEFLNSDLTRRAHWCVKLVEAGESEEPEGLDQAGEVSVDQTWLRGFTITCRLCAPGNLDELDEFHAGVLGEMLAQATDYEGGKLDPQGREFDPDWLPASWMSILKEEIPQDMEMVVRRLGDDRWELRLRAKATT